MSILELEFTDKVHGWSLAKTKFADLNLLVGYSGAGKTRILNAIKIVQVGALQGAEFAMGCTWTIKIEAGGATFNWYASVSKSDSGSGKDDPVSEAASRPTFLFERLILDDGTVLIDRTVDRFVFENRELPRLNQTESAISLLRDEKSIEPIRESLIRIRLSTASTNGMLTAPLERFLSTAKERFPTLEHLREWNVTALMARALILQNEFPEAFQAVCNDYMDIFPTVTDVQVVRVSVISEVPEREKASERLMFSIKERDVEGLILGSDMSSGMLQTLTYLLDMELALPGTVILIDEVENSLGVNCLSAVIDRVNLHARDLQFILTSHHPYIINNIKPKDWRVVMRKGSEIFVKNGDELPALQGGSAQDYFIRLINSQEFEDGLG